MMSSSSSGGTANGAASPRVLAASGPLLLSPLEWTMEAIAEAGFSGVEVMIGHNPHTRDPERVLAAAGKAGLDVPVVHGPYLLLMRTVLGSNYIKKSRRSLEIAAEIGADLMVAHAPFRWERRALRWLQEEMASEAEAIGCRFAMENLFPFGGRNFSATVTPEDMQRYEHLVFDTSHFAVAGIDILDAWRVLADRVVHIHVSDNFGNGKDSHAPIGAGTLPLDAFFVEVHRSGWTGTITLEMDCRSYAESRESLVAFLTQERRKAERLLATAAEQAPTV